MKIKPSVLTVFALLLCQLNLVNAEQILDAPEGSKLLLNVHAKGDQIFKCTQKNGEFTWEWLAPNAKLLDATDNNMEVGTHGAGPSWQHKDGSSIKGHVMQKVPSPDPNAAPWLLIQAKEPGGKGILTSTAFILRTNTQGGLPPKSGCDAGHIGAEGRSAYTADYTFYGL